MHVAYDHQIFSLQPYGGISRYFVELASRVAADPEFTVGITAPMHINRMLAGAHGVSVRGAYVPHMRGTGRVRWLSNTLLGGAWHFASRPDVVHETYFSRFPAAWHGARTVVTVFDMIHELFPGAFALNDSTPARKRAAVKRASRVICISESTRRDLLERIDVDPECVSVVYLAADAALAHVGTGARLLAAPYVLYVGQRNGYKNFDTLLRAFAATGLAARGIVCACFGGGAWSTADRQITRAAELSPESVVHFQGGDEVLSALYRNAELFVYPSVYEGFGLPPLEAMVCGCPVACSSSGSLPEVVGGAAELFDPRDVADVARAIAAVVESSKRAEELRRLGALRASEFSWDRCATETKAIYKSLL